MYRHLPLRLACAAAAIAAAMPLAAHAAVSSRTMKATEQMLAAAGFQAVPANTAERQADMAALPAGRLTAQPRGDGFTYVLADPAGCACLYMGDAVDYQAYQQLAQSQRIARQNADAARANQFSALNWNMWGPYDGWGWQGSTFAHIGRAGFGGHGGGFGGRTGGFGGRTGGFGGRGGSGQHARSGRH
jgi:hypothetical protein